VILYKDIKMKIRKKFADGEAVWQRVWFDEKISKTAIEARKKMGIRPLGLMNEMEFDEWVIDNAGKIKNGFQNFLPFKKFSELAMSRLPYKEHLSENHIKALLWKYLLYNDVSFEFAEEFTPFDLFLLENGNKKYHTGNGLVDMLDGVYLRIPISASIPAIIKYIRGQSKHLKWLQEHSLIKATKSKSLKIRKNFYRDIWIEYYMAMPKSFFENALNRKFNYKEEGIATFFDVVGKGKYTPETIKKAYARSRALRKKLSK